jgi:site-specific recombinase XerD
MTGISRRQAGRLGPQVEGYRAWLERQGYTAGTVVHRLSDLGQLGRWMSSQGLDAAQIDEDVMLAFLAFRGAAGYRSLRGTRAMRPLLNYLREAGVVPPARPPQTPLEGCLDQYRSWLVQERGLALCTVFRYTNTARFFLQQQATPENEFDPARLPGADVNAFLLRECSRVSAGSAKGRVAELRSILRFLYLQGSTPMRLGTAVPPVGGWRLAALPPPTMTVAEVQSLLDSCDHASVLGARDFAIMMLVARLGLRSIEVAQLELADVDWRAGELVVCGKARRQDRLPLPAEVGEALAAYLSFDRRAPDGDRHVFLTCRAPDGPIRAGSVAKAVHRACRRAELPRVGPHRLRHALASELLRQGAGLLAISQVLRHRDLATTALYAKVDLNTLRQVAQPWPGASR